MRYVADAIRKDALAWLFGREGGGWQELKIVAGGRRHELRLWDEKIFSRLDVRFGDGPLKLLVAAMESRWSPPQLPKGLAKAATQADVSTGDLIAYHRIADRLLRLAKGPETARCLVCAAGLEKGPGQKRSCPVCGTKLHARLSPPSERETRIQALIELSPLTQLFRSSEAGRTPAKLRAALAPLFKGERPVLLSYMAASLAKSWLREERRRRKLSAERAQTSYAQSARLLEAFVSHCGPRPDALRPLIEFYRTYVLEHGGRAPVTEALREQAQSFDRISERDAFMKTASELFVPARAIQTAVDLALATSFVDRSEAQKVLLSEYHESFRGEVAAEIEAIRRELASEVG